MCKLSKMNCVMEFIINIFIDEHVEYVYDHFIKSCVSGHNLVRYGDKSISECKALCSARVDCLAFEYGVGYGGSGDIDPNDCLLQDSADKSGCNGIHWNADLYVKLGMIWCRYW